MSINTRADKLIEKGKPFVVVANDEPYYAQVYRIIRDHEKQKGTWTDDDEWVYIASIADAERTTESVSDIYRVIDKEIIWCENNPDKAFSAEYRKGFVNGLIQAKYLIQEIRKFDVSAAPHGADAEGARE